MLPASATSFATRSTEDGEIGIPPRHGSAASIVVFGICVHERASQLLASRVVLKSPIVAQHYGVLQKPMRMDAAPLGRFGGDLHRVLDNRQTGLAGETTPSRFRCACHAA
jgi:hypothetical protein